MPSLVRLWGFVSAYHKEPTVRAIHPTLELASCGGFGRIPIEIIQQIASGLPLSSSAALTLCNKTLNHILGNQYLLALSQTPSSSKEREVFLKALDRDILEAFYCFYCYKLHILTGTHEHGLTDKERFKRVSYSRCLGGDGTYNNGTTHTHHAHFKFEHVQMAMKLYRHGLVSSMNAYLRFSTLLQPAIHNMTSIPGHRGLYFFEPRLVHGQISVRAQSWIFIPNKQGSMLPRVLYATVCAHLDTSLGNKNDFVKLLRYTLEYLDQNCDPSIVQSPKLIRCHYCPTEVQVEAKRVGTRFEGKILVITKWQALGHGSSPFGSNWKSHLQPRISQWSWPPKSQPGIVQASFESQPGLKYDSILSVDKMRDLLN